MGSKKVMCFIVVAASFIVIAACISHYNYRETISDGYYKIVDKVGNQHFHFLAAQVYSTKTSICIKPLHDMTTTLLWGPIICVQCSNKWSWWSLIRYLPSGCQHASWSSTITSLCWFKLGPVFWGPYYTPYIDGILPKGPYLPCVSMAGWALLAGYHRYYLKIMKTFIRELKMNTVFCAQLTLQILIL